MEDLVTDLETVKRLAEEQSDANWRFRYFLKNHLTWPEEKLDAVVQEIARKVAAEIDCAACANCCRTMAVGLEEGDIERLARHRGVTVAEFEASHVAVDDWREKILAESPCPFLEGSLCSVYAERPRGCREFPHLDKCGFASRLNGVMGNAEVCPIVFNTLQLLKRRLGWR
jgi:Fe-S-cluster containining protein